MENTEKPVDFAEAVALWDETRKPWQWYDHVWWWIRRGIWNWITDLKWEIPNLYGRMRRGWGYADTWNFSYYLADVISGGIKHLKDKKHGYAATKDPVTGKLDYDEQRWNDVLENIIYTFETALEITDRDLIYVPLEDWTEEQYQKNLQFAEEMNRKFHDSDIKYKVMTKEEVERYEHGFDCFKRYFHSLWD